MPKSTGEPAAASQQAHSQLQLRPTRLGPAQPCLWDTQSSANSAEHGADKIAVATSCDTPDNAHPHATASNRLAAARLAKRLFLLDGFLRADVAKHLSKVNEFSQLVACEYVSFFELSGEPLDRALRKFVERCVIVGETQERERVLFHFARRFYECNPHIVGSVDSVHTLTCALMLLNVDLHGGKTARKMQFNEFVQNLSGLNDGRDFPKELLKELFYNVKKEALPFPPDDAVTPIDSSIERFDSLGNGVVAVDTSNTNGGAAGGRLAPTTLRCLGVNPLLDVPDSSMCTLHTHTVLMRKCVREPGGRRSPLGRRSWHLYYAAMCDLIIYLFKSQDDFYIAFGGNGNTNTNTNTHRGSRRPVAHHGAKQMDQKVQLNHADDWSSPEKLNGNAMPPLVGVNNCPAVAAAVRLHHAYAEKAVDYKKKENVFRLLTADGAEFLFQAADSHQVLEWIWRINILAARLSAPSLPGAVGSVSVNRFSRFQRPLLPGTITRFTLVQQLNEHRKRHAAIDSELEEVLLSQQALLDSRAASRISKSENKMLLQEHEDRRKYLEFEYRRFSLYIQLLEKECEKEFAQATAASESLLRQPISEDSESEEAADSVTDITVVLVDRSAPRTVTPRQLSINSYFKSNMTTVIDSTCERQRSFSASVSVGSTVADRGEHEVDTYCASHVDSQDELTNQNHNQNQQQLKMSNPSCRVKLDETNFANGHQSMASSKMLTCGSPLDVVDSLDASSFCRSGRGSQDNLSVSTSGSVPVMYALSATAADAAAAPYRAAARVGIDSYDAVGVNDAVAHNSKASANATAASC